MGLAIPILTLTFLNIFEIKIGTGVVISFPVLHMMAPRVEECLADLRSTHEDVEIGRCINRFANVSCLRRQKVRRFMIPSACRSYNPAG